jgi:P27 family predicted phage terminase small subunit
VAAKRQKPPEMLQGKGSRFAGQSSIALTRDDLRPVPIPPKDIRAAARETWNAFWRSPMASLVQDDSDMYALRDWVYCLSERERLQVIVKKTPLIEGASGSLMLNPVARLVKDYTARIDRHREHFGMTPLSRMRLGIAVGEAHDVLADLMSSLDERDVEEFDLGDDNVIIDVDHG